MSWTFEIALRGPAQPDAGSLPDLVAALQNWFVAGPRQALAEYPAFLGSISICRRRGRRMIPIITTAPGRQ